MQPTGNAIAANLAGLCYELGAFAQTGVLWLFGATATMALLGGQWRGALMMVAFGGITHLYYRMLVVFAVRVRPTIPLPARDLREVDNSVK